MRTITAVHANDDWSLDVSFADGAKRRFDVKPLLTLEAFVPLHQLSAFKAVRNGGYFVEWPNDADLSADTLYVDGLPISNDNETERDCPTCPSTR